MERFKRIDDLRVYLLNERQKGHKIGFIPTMGALHEGHISLVNRALLENDVVVVSIFVNPIQFNKQADLDNYPRTIEMDCLKLELAGCHAIFNPSVEEMYPAPDTRNFDFGPLEQVMEGEFRPGHFNGVAIVVSKLFDIVEPDKAYFGQKDFQQLAIIRQLVKMTNSPVEIIGCPTLREESGLAMSSRNLRLSEKERDEAVLIYRALSHAREMAQTNSKATAIKAMVDELFQKNTNLELEYFEIADAETLMPLNNLNESKQVVACIAAWLNGVRLIDNMILVGDL